MMPGPDRNGRLLSALRGDPVDAVPVWFMRQAGRYQPEYRTLRERYGMLEIADTPRLAAEVTVRPVEQLGVDAAILFSDIMVPMGPAGVAFEIREGVGPVVANPVRSATDVARIGPVDPEHDLPHVLEAVERSVAMLGPTPLIGFAGAPFTLASYLIEGRPSRQYVETKRMLMAAPETFDALMARLADIVGAHLAAQARHGAAALQVFDSWAGALAVEDYAARVAPHMARLFSSLAPLGVPVIYFAVGAGHLVDAMAATRPTALSVDWRTPLSVVRSRLPADMALQGNLDPVAVLAPWPALEAAARRVLAQGGRRGYVFNLGHGVLPETDPKTLRRLVALVHGSDASGAERPERSGS
jgi:uroporphyrinogen decarboxylase